MKKDFSELISYLDKKFNSVDESFGVVDERFLGVEKEFQKVHDRLGDLSNQFSSLQTAVDDYAKKANAYFQEMLMLSHKVNRLEKWIKQVANHTGVKLEE